MKAMSKSLEPPSSDERNFLGRLSFLEVDEAALSVELESLSRELGELSDGGWEALSGE